MGFFDRFAAKKDTPAPATPPATTPEATHASSAAAIGGGVLPLLASAREKLEARDLPGAMAIYEELLQTAGDRPDVLVTLSGDLGSCGYVEQIVELVAPRYDADRHGPATGINLLQAYLATNNTTAAQHLLDILFALERPELEQRLYGFSNALAELIEAEKRGHLAAPPAATGEDSPVPGAKPMISLASISRPAWSYGLEPLNLLPTKEGRLRRVTFGQLALPGIRDIGEKMEKAEDELARFSRGFALWLSETFSFSQHYQPNAALGMAGKQHYGLFGSEWTTEHLRQLVSTTEGGLDYVFSGALQHQSGDYELVLRVWEIKKFRERKTFNVHWTPATADVELTKLHEQIRVFMEWSAYPSGTGLTYVPPAQPLAWIHTLGSSISFFLADKGNLPKDQLADPAEALARVAGHAAISETASLAWLTLRDRAIRLGIDGATTFDPPLFSSPLVEQARQVLGRE